MKFKSELIVCSKSQAMIEKADLIHNKITFEGLGSYLIPNKEGILMGIMYRLDKINPTHSLIKINGNWKNQSKGFIGSWNGELKIKAYYFNEWISNFGDTRQSVYFILKNKAFHGIYYKTNSDIIRVKELKNIPPFLNDLMETQNKL